MSRQVPGGMPSLGPRHEPGGGGAHSLPPLGRAVPRTPKKESTEGRSRVKDQDPLAGRRDDRTDSARKARREARERAEERERRKGDPNRHQSSQQQERHKEDYDKHHSADDERRHTDRVRSEHRRKDDPHSSREHSHRSKHSDMAAHQPPRSLDDVRSPLTPSPVHNDRDHGQGRYVEDTGAPPPGPPPSKPKTSSLDVGPGALAMGRHSREGMVSPARQHYPIAPPPNLPPDKHSKSSAKAAALAVMISNEKSPKARPQQSAGRPRGPSQDQASPPLTSPLKHHHSTKAAAVAVMMTSQRPSPSPIPDRSQNKHSLKTVGLAVAATKKGVTLPDEIEETLRSPDGIGMMKKGKSTREKLDELKKSKSKVLELTRIEPEAERMMTVKVKVPFGVKPGELAEFLLPSGVTAQITVPKGAKAGHTISVKVPKAAFSKKKTRESLTPEQLAKAKALYQRVDYDKSGELGKDEVKLVLMEMGVDSSEEVVDEMMMVFGSDGAQTITYHQFLDIVANCPTGDIDWSHIDHDVLAKIEKHVKGDDQVHEGYYETVAFMRRLDKGMHFHRIDHNGRPHHVSIHLSDKRDGLTYAFQSGRQVAFFPFSSLWAVTAPFTDNANTLQLIPPELAKNTIMLVFAMAPEPRYADTIAELGGVPSTPTSNRAIELANRETDKRALVDSSRNARNGVISVANSSAHAMISNALTGIEALLPASNGEVQPISMAVLLIIAESEEHKDQALNGLRILVTNHEYHALDDEGNLKKGGGGRRASAIGRKVNKRSSMFGGGGGGGGGRRGSVAGQANNSSKHPGAFGSVLSMFHHLYRPHHHVNHPPARFHTGIMAEIAYSETYSMSVEIKKGSGRDKYTTVKDINLPAPVFRPHMYLVAKITAYDRDSGTYDLEYASGPYLADEDPDGTKLFKVPNSSGAAVFHLKGVKPTYITVDMYDNFGTHSPTFIVGISFIQCACFLYWVIMREDGVVSSYSPISGPEWSWLRIIGDLGNGCPSLRYDYWRFVSYQFVHNGLVHIFSNMVMQLLFGLPLNMVHGSLRFGLIYELGVMFGALTFVTFDGGFNSVVGCSGGVYCIFGMHLAEIVTNWSLENRGLMNHWTRLLIMAIVLGADGYKIYTSPSETTSYSAHGGGILAGYLCGIIFLDTLETTWFHRYIGGPLVWLLVILLPVCMVAYYMTEDFPPPPIGALFAPSYYEHEPCCWQALACEVERTHFDAFVCQLGGISEDIQTLYNAKNGDELRTCVEIEAAANALYNITR